MNIESIEESFVSTSDGKCSIAERGMVATAFPDATHAGAEMLKLGGNAVDAACAAAMALGVCEPQGSGIGGQSMAILHIKEKTIAINGFGRVPSLASIDGFANKGNRSVGYLATTVPSTVAVLGHLNRRYGRLDWSTILQPAIWIAREGYRISKLQHELQTREMQNFMHVPSRSGARYFLKDGNRPYEVGELFVQKDLSGLLTHLADNGPESFYKGRIPQQIEDDVRAHGGFLRTEDLAQIPWPMEIAPIQCSYRDVTVYTLPPPAAGPTLVLLLRMLNEFPARFLTDGRPESLHYIAETFRKVLLHRIQRPYDHFFRSISTEKLLDHAFAQELTQSISDKIDTALPTSESSQGEEETTHLSVMDSDGNAVGITQSIESVYGSMAAAESLGFLYNNYMSALDIQEPEHPFYLRSNGIPWSSVVPCIVFHDDKPWIVAGTPGSERIYSVISQFMMHIIDGDAPISEAMMRPRLHCTLEGEINLEADRFSGDDISYLEEMGYKIARREPYSFYMGAVHAALKRQTGRGFQGVAEIRRSGIASGI